MECLIVGLALILFLLVLPVTCGMLYSRRRAHERLFRTVAAHFRGQFVRGGWFSYPQVSFLYGETSVLLTAERSYRVLISEMKWLDAHLACYLSARASRSEVFEQRYAIYTDSPTDLQRLLSDGVRWQLDRLRLWQQNHDLEFSVMHGRIVIRKRATAGRAEDLRQFAQLSLDLYDQMLLTQSAGIEFTAASLAQPVQEATCKVCGEEIFAEMVFCSRCKTPHHLECWHYYGACSTYGCGETDFVLPQIAESYEPLDPQDLRSRPKPR